MSVKAEPVIKAEPENEPVVKDEPEAEDDPVKPIKLKTKQQEFVYNHLHQMKYTDLILMSRELGFTPNKTKLAMIENLVDNIDKPGVLNHIKDYIPTAKLVNQKKKPKKQK